MWKKATLWGINSFKDMLELTFEAGRFIQHTWPWNKIPCNQMLNLTYLLLIVWVYAQLHNCVQTSATTWIVAHQASLSTRSSRQGYWNGLPNYLQKALCWAVLYLTLFNSMVCSPPGSSVHRDSPGKNTGVSCHAFLQAKRPYSQISSHWELEL